MEVIGASVDLILKTIANYGVTGLLVIFCTLVLIGLHNQWWVPGWVYKEVKAREQEWKDLANGGVDSTHAGNDELERALEVIREHAEQPERPPPRRRVARKAGSP